MEMIHETRSIFYIYKLGDQRTFASPTAPSVEWAASLKQQGYTIVKVEFVIPVPADDTAFGTVGPSADREGQSL